MKETKLDVQWVDISKVIPYARNAKKHPQSQIDKIVSSLHTFGWRQPLVVDKDWVLITGHGRLEAAKQSAISKVPVIIAADMTEHDAMAYRIADNRVSESEWDSDFLHFELNTLSSYEYELGVLGFDDSELNEFIDPGEPEDNIPKDLTEKNEFILILKTEDEEELRSLYDEMIGRNIECKML